MNKKRKIVCPNCGKEIEDIVEFQDGSIDCYCENCGWDDIIEKEDISG